MHRVRRALVVFSLICLGGTPVLAQGGEFNRAAFEKWRNEHKYTFQLVTTVTRGLTECERVKDTQIKPDQAKKILAVLTPLRKQPKLTQDQAKAAIQKLQRVFNTKQLTAVDKALKASQNRGSGGPGGGGGNAGARPGGGGGRPGGTGGSGGGGNRLRFDPAKMQNFNPFNPASGSAMYERSVDRNKRLFAFLQARAAGKAATLQLPQRGGGRM